MARGVLTDEVKAIMMQEGFDGNVKELRLLPYLLVKLLDNTNIEPSKIDSIERGILSKWQQKGWIDSPSTNFSASREFLHKMHKVLELGYLDEVLY